MLPPTNWEMVPQVIYAAIDKYVYARLTGLKTLHATRLVQCTSICLAEFQQVYFLLQAFVAVRVTSASNQNKLFKLLACHGRIPF